MPQPGLSHFSGPVSTTHPLGRPRGASRHDRGSSVALLRTSHAPAVPENENERGSPSRAARAGRTRPGFGRLGRRPRSVQPAGMAPGSRLLGRRPVPDRLRTDELHDLGRPRRSGTPQALGFPAWDAVPPYRFELWSDGSRCSPAPPGPAADVTASPDNHEATVSFTAPAPDGLNAVSVYTVTATPGGAQATGVASPLTVAGSRTAPRTPSPGVVERRDPARYAGSLNIQRRRSARTRWRSSPSRRERLRIRRSSPPVRGG